ncbi:MAG TPA: hypothetical protein VNV41_04800 [Candidatus Acidoferrales bacterium]|nr:hypothetical protein [Candidatus Acidoferrales bacterium]
MESHQQQKDLVREQFTRTAQVFADYALSSRVAEVEQIARMVRENDSDRAVDLACGPGTQELLFTNTTLFIAGEKI